MYRLEITTADERETLLYLEDLKTWTAASEKITFFNNLKLDNIFIKLYKIKETDPDLDLEYLGNFTNLETCKRQPEKKRIKKSNIIIILEIILFPVMLLLDLVNE